MLTLATKKGRKLDIRANTKVPEIVSQIKSSLEEIAITLPSTENSRDKTSKNAKDKRF